MRIFKSPPIHRTPLYRAKRAYKDMIERCGNPTGKNPSYANVELRMSLDEWLLWAIPRYEKCIANHPDESPSVSRFGDTGHYEISNLEIIPFKKNRAQQKFPNQLQSDGTKRCSRCFQIKKAAEFPKLSRAFDGLDHWCRKCGNKYIAEYYGRPYKDQ
jgi:hypothetical protein